MGKNRKIRNKTILVCRKYTRNSKTSTQKLLEITNKLGNESEYRTDLQKSIAFLHTNNIQRNGI